MKSFQDLISNCIKSVDEVMPWDLQEEMETGNVSLLVDIREPYEFEPLHIKGSINVPRGILESTCDYGYDETLPSLASARDKNVIVICRSGNRSVLAAHTMQLMGYQSVKSLKLGVKGWNDFDLPLQDIHGQEVDVDEADTMLMPKVKPEQLPPTT